MTRTDWSLAASVRRWVQIKPDAPCVTFEGATLTWSEFFNRSAQLAQGLIAAGFEPRCRAAYLGRNRPEFFEILVGAAMAGGVTGAVNWRLSPREMLGILNHSKPATLFVDPEFLGQLAQFREQLEFVTTIVVLPGSGAEGRAARDLEYEGWLGRQLAKDPDVAMTADDTGLLMYTSGTTGLPKGAMFSNRALAANEPMAELTNVTDSSVVLIAMPVFHASGSTLGILAMRMGASMVIAREVVPDQLLALISRHHVTMTTVVPSVLKMMLESPALAGANMLSLDTIAYAASPISPDLLRASLAAFRCRFLQIYGLTETNGVTALRPEDHLDPEHPERMLSAGRALDGASVRIVDPTTGRDVPEGEFGEVWIKADTTMTGYFENEDENRAAFGAGGYLRSGDGAYMVDGYVYLKDRIKDMVVSGGENVYSVEVENVLIADERIRDVAVIGVPSPKWGESVKAIVVREPGHESLTAADVIAWAKANLASYKCPTSVEFVDFLPRNPTGKILKRVLRQQFGA
jgi:long-chain acyl-CoA synthetase